MQCLGVVVAQSLVQYFGDRETSGRTREVTRAVVVIL